MCVYVCVKKEVLLPKGIFFAEYQKPAASNECRRALKEQVRGILLNGKFKVLLSYALTA